MTVIVLLQLTCHGIPGLGCFCLRTSSDVSKDAKDIIDTKDRL